MSDVFNLPLSFEIDPLNERAPICAFDGNRAVFQGWTEPAIEAAATAVNSHDRLEQENAELREHLGNLITESTRLAEFKNETLRKGICSTDLDEPEWHDYQTIGEAAEYLGKLLNK